ncbi:DUF1826 domain-containing protein [Anderseniella sp. Alg231-50]|uniref:DUF1826 domain-containing protein n=1 Tax=Anderseniella sp. Alg231-50 TaxID=1922226 RepID=UPI000D5536B1
MNYHRQFVRNAGVGVGLADSPQAMNLIHTRGAAAVIWKRQPARCFQAWIDSLDPACLPRARVVLQPHSVRDVVALICLGAGMPDGEQPNVLVDDIAALADVFATLMNTSYLRLRLDVVNDNACRKFHIDAVTARLVCTYRGLGTQYGISTDGAEPARVFTVPTGAPIILRGTKWPDPPPSGLLHRSPPIEGTGETRLVLVLDPVGDELASTSPAHQN